MCERETPGWGSPRRGHRLRAGGPTGMGSHLVEQHLVVHLLLELALRPFLRAKWGPEAGEGEPAAVESRAERPNQRGEPPGRHPIAARTFFFPLLELAAAMAFASFDFCSLGACTQPSHGWGRQRGQLHGLAGAGGGNTHHLDF